MTKSCACYINNESLLGFLFLIRFQKTFQRIYNMILWIVFDKMNSHNKLLIC
jgi:hypothetical protein